MLKNFFTTALRSMRRQQGYTLLNLVGLTVGISASLLIVLYLTQQLSFDTQHEKRDRIVRISSEISEPDDSFRWSVTQSPLAPELARRFPEVEAAVRVHDLGRVQFTRDDQTFLVEKVYNADSSLLDIFTFDVIAGDQRRALHGPHQVMLSRSVAERIFGTTDMPSVIGRTLTMGENQPVKVTAVYTDMPETSHIIFHAIHPIHDPEGSMEQPGSWGGFYLYTYALLKPGVSARALEAKLADVITEFVVPIFEQFGVTVV